MKVIVVPPKGDEVVRVEEIGGDLASIKEILGGVSASAVYLWPRRRLCIYCDDNGALKPDRQLSRYVSCQRGWIELYGTFIIVGQRLCDSNPWDDCYDPQWIESDVPEDEIEMLLEIFSYDAIEVLETGYMVYPFK